MINSCSAQEDTVLPSPEVLCSRLLSSGKIREEDGGSICNEICSMIITNNWKVLLLFTVIMQKSL